MRVERRENMGSSGVAKAGLATGTVGASLGVLNMLGTGANLLGFGARNCGCNGMNGMVCNEDHLVDRYTLQLEAKIAEKDTQIALRDANTFTDQKQLEMYKYVDARLRDIERQLCAQEVKNQSTSDSFQIINERLQCCCDSMAKQIEAEARERACADNRLEDKIQDECRNRQCADNAIVNYSNATFYPKQVADVTVGSTTVPQSVYNPLPAQGCGKCC